MNLALLTSLLNNLQSYRIPIALQNLRVGFNIAYAYAACLEVKKPN